MRYLVTLGVLIFLVVFGLFWVNSEINKRVQENKEPVTSEQIQDAELQGATEKTYDPQQAGLNK